MQQFAEGCGGIEDLVATMCQDTGSVLVVVERPQHAAAPLASSVLERSGRFCGVHVIGSFGDGESFVDADLNLSLQRVKIAGLGSGRVEVKAYSVSEEDPSKREKADKDDGSAFVREDPGDPHIYC